MKLTNTERPALFISQLFFRVQEVMGTNLSSEPDDFRGFPQPLRENGGVVS
jgi:hypothetical protein